MLLRHLQLNHLDLCLLSCPGLGGHCIPIDPIYLSWKCNQKGYNCEFIFTEKNKFKCTNKILKEILRIKIIKKI